MNPDSEDLDDVLKRLLASFSEVKAAVIVSLEGLPIASALPQGVDETRLAALTAALQALANHSVMEMKKGNFDQLYIKGSNGCILVQQADPNTVLAISTTKDIRLGSTFLDIIPQKWLEERAYQKIISLMARESVSELTIERKYIPEIFSESVIKIARDGLPSIKKFAVNYFLFKGISTFYYGNVLKFVKKD